jgi:hypothetical protein
MGISQSWEASKVCFSIYHEGKEQRRIISHCTVSEMNKLVGDTFDYTESSTV